MHFPTRLLKSAATCGAGWLILTIFALGVASAADAPDPVAHWTAEWRRYAVQDNLDHDGPYPGEHDGPALPFVDLLRTLPGPADWPRLRQTFATAAAQATAPVEKKRLQAGEWLAAYLLNDRAALLAALPAAPPQPGEEAVGAYAVRSLRDSLSERKSDGPPAAEQLQRFDDQLAWLEPVDLAAVKQLLGGDDLFNRLNRLLKAGEAMNEKMQPIAAEFEKNHDRAATLAKMEALHAEFEREYGSDQRALMPYGEKPWFRRYVESALRKDTPEPDREAATVTLPDLVTLAGRERAEALLHRAFRLPVKLETDDKTGEATLKLARELLEAEVSTVKAPSWGLVQSADAAPLFARLSQRFPADHAEGYAYRTAAGFYVAGLIRQGRIEAAVDFVLLPANRGVLEFSSDRFDELEHGPSAEFVWQFLRDWLTRAPAVDEWPRFNRLSVELGHAAELRTLIDALAARTDFTGPERLRVKRLQAGAELATDDLPAAAAHLTALLKMPATSPDERKAQYDIGETLLHLAHLRADPAAFAAALAATEAVLAPAWAEQPADTLEAAANLSSLLAGLGHVADAARIAQAAGGRVPGLLRQAAEKKEDQNQQEKFRPSPYALRRLLGEQLRAAVELENWPEAVRLVHESPWWRASDASDLLQERVSSNQRPVGYYLARIAQHEKQEPVARRILEAQLVSTPGADAVYEAYLRMVGQAARPLLAKLAKSDRYEERPLIWLGHLQAEAGEWDAAIATLQQAIGIDPSDGEQGVGDRMRVYAFMARAVAAKGDKEKAAFLEGVVKAIRLSETADRWYEIRAYSHAIDLYQQALGFFQDAYCIQSRLAVQLANQGKLDEAAEHYRRAFELMPDSFGRVESHCFGCDHVFSGAKSQGVAEKVFARMLSARPEKPQLHYLMGYLREQQERYAEAAEHFRQATKLDPLYLNAWSHLERLDTRLHFTATQRDDLLLTLSELDPTRRHASPSLDQVTDLPRLFRVLQQTREQLAQLPNTESLWALEASAQQMKETKDRGEFSDFRNPSRDDFAAVLTQHPFVEALREYLANLNAPPP